MDAIQIFYVMRSWKRHDAECSHVPAYRVMFDRDLMTIAKRSGDVCQAAWSYLTRNGQ